MNLKLDNKIYKIEIIKKKNTKNTYIRVKENLNIVITTNIFTSDKAINRILEQNINSIEKMIQRQKDKQNFNNKFYYLGKEYDIIYTNNDEILFGTNKVFIGKNNDIDKYLQELAYPIFLERLNSWYNRFTRKIPYPSLKIRKMKSRWGVCNVKDKKITLNLELIKHDVRCLDYVIVHELSHFIFADHSKKFWDIVEDNYCDYKNIRKMLKKY